MNIFYKIKYFVQAIMLVVLLLLPVQGYSFGGEITSPFSNGRLHPTLGVVRVHEGIDIGIPEGTAVPSAVDGVVDSIGYNAGGYGYFIVINSNRGESILYGHGSGYPLGIVEGAPVKKGQIVFISGNTGASSGAHLHAEYHPNGYRNPVDPVDFYTRAGWNLTGDTSGNTRWDGKVFGGALPNIDMDYTTYFEPSITLVDLGQKVLDVVTNIGKVLSNHIVELLLLILAIDLSWTVIKSLMGQEPLTVETFIPRIIRYGVFIALAKSWDYIVKHVLNKLFIDLASTYTKDTYSQETFLAFDTLFNSVKESIGGYLHLQISGWDVISSFFPFLMQNICVIVVLICCIAISIFMIEKLIRFYMLLGFSIIGIPIRFLPVVSHFGSSMLGATISAVLDLVLTAFIVGLVVLEIQNTGVLPQENTGILLTFTIKIIMLTAFVGRISSQCVRTLGSFRLG